MLGQDSFALGSYGNGAQEILDMVYGKRLKGAIWWRGLGKSYTDYANLVPLNCHERKVVESIPIRAVCYAAQLAMHAPTAPSDIEKDALRGLQRGKSGVQYIDSEGGFPVREEPSFAPCLKYARTMQEEDIPRALVEIDLPGHTPITAHLCAVYVSDPKKKWWMGRGFADLSFNYATLMESKDILLKRIGAK